MKTTITTILTAIKRQALRFGAHGTNLSFQNIVLPRRYKFGYAVVASPSGFINQRQANLQRNISLAFCFFFLCIATQAQVTVTATLGTTGPTYYTTLNAAFTAVNLGVHQGSVDVAITGNTVEGSTAATLNKSGAGSASYNALLVHAAADSVTISGSPGAGYGVIQLNGASNVSIDGQNSGGSGNGRNLYIINNSANTAAYSSCIRLATSSATGSCNNITVNNCNLVGNATGRNAASYTSVTGSENTSFGIYAGGNGGLTSITAPLALTSVTANSAPVGTTINSLDIDHNFITACARGIVFNGADTTVANTLLISKNIIGADAVLSGTAPFNLPATTVYSTGIYIAGTKQINLTGNMVQNMISYVNANLVGIDLNNMIGAGGVTLQSNSVSVINNGSGGAVGINIAATQSSPGISSNHIGPVQTVSGNLAIGLQLNANGASSLIQRNNVTGIYAMAAGGGAYGINIIGANNDTLINNFISDVNAYLSSGSISTSQGVHGIRIASGTGAKIYFNNINLSGGFLGASASGMASAITVVSGSVTGLEFRNNVFANTMTGGLSGTVVSCIALPAGLNSSFNFTANNNAYFGSQLGQQGTASVSVFTISGFNAASTAGAANWRSYTSTLALTSVNDNASYSRSVAAPFLSATNLRIDTTSLEAAYLYEKAFIIPTVIYDFDGGARSNSSPDIGANEFIYSLCAGTPVAGNIQALPDSVCSGRTSILSLHGQTTATGISLLWKWGTVSGGPYTNTGDTTTSENVGGLTVDRYYICQLTCNAGGTTVVTPEKQIVAVTITAIANNSGPYTVGQTVNLSSLPTGAAAYVWVGPNGFTSGVQNPFITNISVADAGTYTVTVSGAGGCIASASTTVVINNSALTTWTGSIDTNWNVAANWSPQIVPNSCAANVFIPLVGNQPVITTTVSIGNLQMNDNVSLTLNSDLNLCGNLTGGNSANAIVGGNGSVILHGNAQQLIEGQTQVNILKVNNSAGVAMLAASDLDVFVSLDLQAGTFDAGSGTITFKSTSSDQVAILDNFSAGYSGTFSGSMNAQRYYDASLTYQQHFMSSPVNTPAFSQFGASGTAGYVIPTANCDETQVASNSPYGTVFSYDETHGAICSYAEWKVEIGGSAQNALGYSILRTGAGVLTLSGAANLSSTYVAAGLTNSNWSGFTLQGRPQNSGWHLIANPYMATLNMQTVNSDFDGQIQVWNADGPYAGTYQPFMVGTNAIIAPFQSFMVHKTVAGGTADYTTSAADRVRTPQQFYNLHAKQLTITAANVSSGMLDKTVIGFNAHATQNFDPKYDANKFANALNRHTLYSLQADGAWMALNIMQSIEQTPDVAMGFEPGIAGNFSLNFGGVNTFDATSYILLEDKKLNVMYNTRNGNYNFVADASDNWNRFVVHFTPATQVNLTNATCNALGNINVIQAGPATWNYTITDSANAVIANGILNQYNQVTLMVNAGEYTLTLVDSNGYTATSNLLVAGSLPITADILLSANTVEVNQNLVATANAPGAVSYLWDLGNGTSGTGATATFNYLSAGNYTVMLTVINDYQCSASASKMITVAGNSTTAINAFTDKTGIDIWSNTNQIYVDFRSLNAANAIIVIYNILGQEVSREKVSGSLLYNKQINDVSAAYFIVDVINSDNSRTIKKVFIDNAR